MDYEKKYKEALECIRVLYNSDCDMIRVKRLRRRLELIFPELKESDDERIRKEIIDFLRLPHPQFVGKRDHKKWIAWLEKQGNKSVNIDVESMVSLYEQRLKSQGGTKYSPLANMCLTAFRHGVENVLEELNLKKLEKQGEQMNKPKFKVGDWITDGSLTCKVLGVTGKSYELHIHNDDYCHFETDIQSVDKYYRLWTIQDAKDGDVLVCEDENFTIPFIAIYKCLGDTVYNYKGLKDLTFNSHCFMGFNGNFYEGEGGHVIEGIHPGTKEQRDLLFQKMKEAGYEWDADKKELKKIEVASKESEDERIRKSLINFLKSPFVNENITDEKVAPWIAWLEKQGEEEYGLRSFRDKDVHKFMQYIEKQAKAYEFNLPNRSYDIYAFAKDILIWLEKQGEQMTKPKFKVRDWIVDDKTPNDAFYVIEVLEEIYKVIDNEGDDYHIPHSKADKQFHLWTIDDAKKGDILVVDGIWIVEFDKKMTDGCQWKDASILTSFEYDMDDDICTKGSHMFYKEIWPASKEDIDLFKKKRKQYLASNSHNETKFKVGDKV